VLRIVAGYREIYCVSHRHCQQRHYQAFINFVFSPHRAMGLQNTYRPTCNSTDTANNKDNAPFHWNASIDTIIQHWAPPQHCRCGIHDCGIQYTYYHLERIPSTQFILNQYLLQLTTDDDHDHDHDDDSNDQQQQSAPSWMAPTHARANANGDTEQMIRFLLGTFPTNNNTNNNSDMDTMQPSQQHVYDHDSSYNTTMLDYLNNLTRPEQEYFGYLPLTVENILYGNVHLITDLTNHDDKRVHQMNIAR
jgi:hypothetical protein